MKITLLAACFFMARCSLHKPLATKLILIFQISEPDMVSEREQPDSREECKDSTLMGWG